MYIVLHNGTTPKRSLGSIREQVGKGPRLENVDIDKKKDSFQSYVVNISSEIIKKKGTPMDNRLHTYEPICKDFLGSFELRREKEHKREMCEELREEIEMRDDAIFREADRRCSCCGGMMHSHGKTNAIRYFAVCGEVSVKLRRLRCTACHHIFVPGSYLVPDDGVSAVLSERICDLSCKMPYAKAADSLYIQHGIMMSDTKFWEQVQKESSKIGDVIRDETNRLYETGEIPDCIDLAGEKPLIIGVDGGWVKGWKQNPSFEVKCATIATGSIPGKGKRNHLTDRVGYAALCSVDEFRQRISLLAIKSGYLTASIRIFVSDGASWIGKMIEDYFPEAVHVLDMYHLKNKVHALFGLKAEGLDRDICEKALAACDRYEPAAIIASVSSWMPSDKGKLDAKTELIHYIENNSKAIQNHNLVHIHGSGWIEKGVDLMISRRLKNRGMAWTVNGSAHMIPFSVLRFNKQWSVYWNKRKGNELVAA